MKELEQKDIKDCQAVVGLLMYAALATGQDISYAVAALSYYNLWPFTSHMTAAKSGIQYLKSTPNFRLHFTGNGHNIHLGISIDIRNSLVGYSDCDWTNDTVDSNFVGVHLNHANNATVSLQSRKQDLIAS